MVDDQVIRAAPTRPRNARPHPGRAAATHVDNAEHLAIALPGLGTVRLPRPEQIAYYGAVGILVALEVIDWPVAVVVAAGHALANQQRHRTIQEFGEGLEAAER
jgi:xanthosine utilization system XapX-like protein